MGEARCRDDAGGARLIEVFHDQIEPFYQVNLIVKDSSRFDAP